MTALLLSHRCHADHGAEVAAVAARAGHKLDLIVLPPERDGRLGEADCARVEAAFFSGDVYPDYSRQFFSAARKASNLKWLHVFNAGVDHPIYSEMLARGVRLTTSSGSTAAAVAQTAIAGLLILARNFPHWIAAQRHRAWQPMEGRAVPPDLEGQTVLILGLGHIGKAFARIAQAHYAHLWRLLGEFIRFRWLSAARKRAVVRIENLDAFAAAFHRGKGVLVLTGHFGNWEVATVAGIQNHPEVHGRFHFVRRPIKPRWLDGLVTRRFNHAGFGVIAKRGSLDRIVTLLERGDIVVFPFDQYAGGADGIDVEFFGHPAGTFKSLAVLALATGAPVVPAACWREPDGRHVLRFDDPVPLADVDDATAAIARTTRAFNATLERLVLRHPEQWWWVHRRWKPARARRPANRETKLAPGRTV